MQPSEARPIPSEPPSTQPGEKAVTNKATRSPQRTKIQVPLDILISLLRPDELAKLQKYVTAYLDTHKV